MTISSGHLTGFVREWKYDTLRNIPDVFRLPNGIRLLTSSIVVSKSSVCSAILACARSVNTHPTVTQLERIPLAAWFFARCWLRVWSAPLEQAYAAKSLKPQPILKLIE